MEQQTTYFLWSSEKIRRSVSFSPQLQFLLLPVQHSFHRGKPQHLHISHRVGSVLHRVPPSCWRCGRPPLW